MGHPTMQENDTAKLTPTKSDFFRLFLFQRSCELDETCFSFGHYCRKMG